MDNLFIFLLIANEKKNLFINERQITITTKNNYNIKSIYSLFLL